MTATEDTALEDTALEDTALEDTALEDTALEDIVSRCPVCGARVQGNVGTPTPPHEVDEGTGPCPGEGRPSE
jgi:hypothetical protein